VRRTGKTPPLRLCLFRKQFSYDVGVNFVPSGGAAGFAILAEEGITAMKIDRLCGKLAEIKGSFYWHFTDIAGYRETLITAWGDLRDEDRSHFGDMARMPPRERLSQMASSLLSARHWTLERAMREWARSDDADLRANATFAAGIGFLHLSGNTPSTRGAARLERFLDLMLTR
jgi:hypothetical protein